MPYTQSKQERREKRPTIYSPLDLFANSAAGASCGGVVGSHVCCSMYCDDDSITAVIVDEYFSTTAAWPDVSKAALLALTK